MPPHLTLQSWNCFGATQSLKGFLLRRGAVDAERFVHEALALACDDVDVLCMQELWLEEAQDFFSRRKHPHKHLESNEISMRPLAFGGSGLGIASQWPIELTTSRTFRPPHVGTERFARKGMLHARVSIPDGETSIDVITTHLQSGDESAAGRVRSRQLQELRALIEEVSAPNRAMVVCGDFNVDGHALVRDDAKAMRLAMAGFTDLGQEAGLSTFDPKQNALARRAGKNAPDQRLDYVLFRGPSLGPPVRATEVRLLLTAPLVARERPLFASDHAALRVELTVG